ncbi:transferrin [Hylaeus anthracinus]|uniref:transferrin n=1 Tax=Hylaeus anthracinus TaxID=313031 RepID=UPI0023B8B7D2|nr:transferrin [Hylaeus anthracinus]
MRFGFHASLVAFATFAIASASFVAAGTSGASPGRIFTICVPHIYWEECAEMIKESAVRGIPISCISGRDRLECIDKVGKKEADVVAVDPEDMYMAAQNNELAAKAGYNVVEQVRTKEEPDAIYRYEAVSVVHKDLPIDNVQGLRGLRSCHTGVGRNVGYKIPITKLTAMGVLNNVHDPQYSARENELRALSSLFSKGCLVGNWSPDPAINQRLKETYSNMCALCEKPDVCNYPDIYSGYEGALRCLVHNGGQVAWTKVIYVKRFFGLPVGVSPAVPTSENPADYRYFCPDGSKVPIDENTKPCTWAARPWQGYMTNGGVGDVQALQKELTDLGKLGEQEKAPWWKDIMLLDNKTLAVAAPPVSPVDHLKSSKYLDVIERDSGSVGKRARWCVSDQGAYEKCQALSKSAFSRDVRPKLMCSLEKDQNACLKALQEDKADMTVVEGGTVHRAVKDFNAIPIIAESYGPGSTEFGERPAVAVVKKGTITGFDGLRGKKSCHSGYKGDFAGWAAPVNTLKKKGLINSENDTEDFFSGSCAPGAPIESKLCQQCIGNSASNNDQLQNAAKCKRNGGEAFSGGKGALACLNANKGDVAFVPLTALSSLEETNRKEGKESSDLVLLCPDGGTAPSNEWQRCNLGVEPPRVILSSAGKSVNALDELTHGTLAASSLYAKRPDLLNLFGIWAGMSDALFRNDAKGLVSIDKSWNKWNEWQETQRSNGIIP